MGLVRGGWYTFACVSALSKFDVHRTIEALYSVNVLEVRSSIMPGKTRRVGRKGVTVEKSNWKKVMVLIKPGQTIEAFQIGGSQEDQGK